MAQRTIWLQPEAPPQPDAGEPCNGCGVCCAAEPCPMGWLLTWRRTGACRALQWDDGARRYRCGVLAAARPGSWRETLARRWIAAGVGCDCTLRAGPTAS